MKIKTVEEYLKVHGACEPALTQIRGILLELGLEETVKWGAPMYTHEGKNVVGLGAFKTHFGIWFFQGALLKDQHKKLINAQEGKTQAMRQWRFAPNETLDLPLIKKYTEEAIANQAAGKEIKPQKKPLILSDELKEVLTADNALAEAFEELTLTQKREFAEYIALAKQNATKAKRLEKIIPMIKTGIGLNDKTVNIRPYTPNDFKVLIEAFELNTPDYFDPMEIEDFKKYLESEPSNHYVLEVGERVAGCSGYDFNAAKGIGQISWVFFHPDFHGKGLGKKVVGYCMEQIMAHDHVEAVIVRTSQLAYHFFEKFGFEVVEVKKDYWGKGLDLYYMAI